MRVEVLGALAVAAAAAEAEPRLEGSGFVGVGYLPSDVQLGDSWAPEQVPGSAPIVGGRLHILVAPDLAPDDEVRVQFGLEAEVLFASAFTGSTMGAPGRASYFAPVLGWRAHGRLRFDSIGGVKPHILAGLGGATVASASPFMRKETDPLFYWGPGVGIPIEGPWELRIDARHGLMAARDGISSTFEIQFGVGATFGLPTRRSPTSRVEPPPEQPVVDETDSDGDGLPDHLDACADQRETVNGVVDGDGCPESDEDGDGIIAAADKCPRAAEDVDGVDDADGCPDLDNDGDGIEDARDACPIQPETVNGIDDADGCPDQLPAEVTAALAVKLTFEANRARVTPKAETALAPVLTMLQQHRGVRIVVVGHPPAAGKDDLARRRADAVKWYLVDQGVVADRIETRVGDTGTSPIHIELAVK